MYSRYLFSLLGIAIFNWPAQVILANPRVAEIARKTTVRIENANNPIASGSGFIIRKTGNNTYTVLTANHVVLDPQASYRIYTHDGRVHSVTRVQNLDTAPYFYDIALVTFTSDNNYELAILGDSDSAQEGEPIFVSGFPFTAQNRQEYQLNSGIVTSRVTQREKGYTMRYNVPTAGGMSGGAVFNSQGQVIGIHGQGDVVEQDVSIESRAGGSPRLKVGINSAIPIRLFAQASDTGINLEPTLRVAVRPGEVDLFYARGQTKLADGDFAGAIADFTESIKRRPDHPEAYNGRASARFRLGDTAGALSDLNTAIRLRPNYAVALNNRGAIKRELKDLAGALQDYNQALKISPRSAGILNNRALVLFDQGNLQGAINDFNQAIALQPRNGDFYFNRAVLKYRTQDYRGAVPDFNQAVRINPKDTDAIAGRAFAKIELKNYEDAIGDLDLAISSKPTAESYFNRGLAKALMGNLAGSIIDFNQAINLKPDYADAYKNRGIAKAKQGDMQGAVADLRRAAELYQGKNETAFRETQEILNQLPQR
ncbi:MAG: tetratricopeptide repeat-containing serine protease family protein [Pseudanabaenaceae cyanobacterium]